MSVFFEREGFRRLWKLRVVDAVLVECTRFYRFEREHELAHGLVESDEVAVLEGGGRVRGRARARKTAQPCEKRGAETHRARISITHVEIKDQVVRVLLIRHTGHAQAGRRSALRVRLAWPDWRFFRLKNPVAVLSFDSVHHIR